MNNDELDANANPRAGHHRRDATPSAGDPKWTKTAQSIGSLNHSFLSKGATLRRPMLPISDVEATARAFPLFMDSAADRSLTGQAVRSSSFHPNGGLFELNQEAPGGVH
jgi:hypothetical protein